MTAGSEGSVVHADADEFVHRHPVDHRGTLLVRELTRGRPVMLQVRTGTESIGYLVAAAEQLDTATAAFLIGHTDGFICVAMESDELDRLHLPPMATFNEAADGANYTITVDAVEGVGTGISAHDRACTIRALAAADTAPGNLTRPGHVLPVRVGCASVEHWGAADAAVAMTRLAGLRHAAAYAPILNDRGDIADHRQLAAMAEQFDLLWIAGESLRSDAVELGDSGPHTLDTRGGRFQAYEYWSPVDRATRVAFSLQ
jgi:3,4-dihydroxy-2-butanone 4-phosphate synthase